MYCLPLALRRGVELIVVIWTIIWYQTTPKFCTSGKPEPEFSTPYVLVIFVFTDIRDGIVDWLFKRPVHKTLNNANEYPYLLLYHMILFKSFHWSIRCHLISIISHIVRLKVILAPFNVGIIQTRLDYMSYNVGVLEEAETEHFGSPPDFWVGVVFLTFFTFCVVFCFVFYCFVVVLFCLFSSCVLRALCC